jgi:HEAT repeat protein
MNPRIIAPAISTIVVAGAAVLLIGCGKSNVSSEQNQAEPTSPTSTNNPVRSDEVSTPFASPVQPGETAGLPRQVASAADKSQAENQLSVALAQYPVADEETRTNIVEHLAELVDKGVDEADVAKALGSMFAMEKSAAVKVSILDELDGLAPPSLFEQVMPALLANQPLEVRDEAIGILKDLGDKRAIPALQTLLADPDDDIREEAEDAINHLNSLQ